MGLCFVIIGNCCLDPSVPSSAVSGILHDGVHGQRTDPDKALL